MRHAPHRPLLVLFFLAMFALWSACSGGDTTGGASGDDTTASGDDSTSSGDVDPSTSDAVADDTLVDPGDAPSTSDAGPVDLDGGVSTGSPDGAACDASTTCCSEDGAALLAQDLDVLVGGCIDGCLDAGAADTQACISTCVADTTGASEPCSACFGALFMCISSECAGDDACVQSTCQPSLFTCLGVDDSPVDAPGECTNDADMSLIEAAALDAMFTGCGDQCLAADDPGACLQDCALEAGFTAGCSGCFGEFGDCTVVSCSEVCTVETADELPCQLCIQAACAPESDACTGLPLFEDPEEAACASEDDQALLTMEGEPTTECWETCVEDGDPQACMNDCLSVAGLSSGCSSCLGGFFGCISDKCAMECNGDAGNDEACEACLTTNCLADWISCTGFTDNEPADDEPLCGGEEDAAILGTDPDLAQTCSLSCVSDSDPGLCIIACLEGEGLSLGCSNCVAWVAGCVFEFCAEPCLDPNQQDACDACMLSNCSDQGEACFGVSDSPDPDPDPDPNPDLPTEGICGNDADETILYVDGASQTCGVQCWAQGEPGQCVEGCLLENGVSDECAACMKVLMPCIFDNCMQDCSGGPPQLCNECVAELCPMEGLACFGVPEGIDP
ncbi:MAG: hypothetical protein QF464_00095 [Myxococcota bacterium]|jgi:hypothetical protein|nr:hypothetical protein [Myxococcota bacterium]